MLLSVELTESEAALAINGGARAVTAEAPVSLAHGTEEIGDEEIEAVTRVLRSKQVFRYFKNRGDSVVAQFEDLFAEKTRVPYVLAVNSGTSALICGLVGIGVSQGDEVLVPAYTYIATAAAVLALGAFPVLVEVDGSLTMNPEDIEHRITPRTKAIIPVHMRGVPCDLKPILKIANRNGLMVLEDCAQANGAFYHGAPVGAWGDAGAFSMQQSKVITCGEGGIVTAKAKRVFERAAIYHDSAYSFWMEGNPQAEGGNPLEAVRWRNQCFPGENYRQSELHGAVALEQLKKRDRILERTRVNKKQLRAACAEIPGAMVEISHDLEGDCGLSLAFFMADADAAQKISETLQAEGVPCGTRFSRQIPDRHIFFHWDYLMEKRSPHLNGYPWNMPGDEPEIEYTRDMCPQTVNWMERAVILPIGHLMSEEYVAQICAAIRKVAKAL
ncbi:MAG: aminotransferase class I/II-fold pyridoxal phosphate-dependent enzyme [Chthoniobacterales bacterium]